MVDASSIDRLIETLQSERARAAGKFASLPPTPPLDPPPITDSSDGMDPWQTSVETRLSSLDARLGRIETAVSDVRVSVGELKSKVDALPSKDWVSGMMRNWVLGAVAFLTLVEVGAKYLHLG